MESRENSLWQDFFDAVGMAAAAGAPEHLADAAAELAAAKSGSIVVPLTHLALISASGDDARSFLHGQLTSDVNHLGADALQHSAWCNAKGRMLASFIVWRSADAFNLALAADLQAALGKRLQMYVLRAKVKIGAPQLLLFGLAGSAVDATLAALDLPTPAALHSAEQGGVSVLRLDATRCLLAASPEQAATLWPKLAARLTPAGIAAWRWLDVRAGLPLISAATKELFVPQMADFERIGGVSFHKGCYPGQEIVARTQYLGKVKRRLYRLRGATAMASGDELFSPLIAEQSCGTVISAAPSPDGGYEALAVLMESAASAPDANIALRERGASANLVAQAVAA